MKIGSKIAHYLIQEKLGEGGMGIVYKAEDTILKRLVALKFLKSQAIGSEEEKARFLREAQAAAALDHPNICTVHEIKEVDGQTFIAMAYIDGQSLDEIIESGPLECEQALDIAIQVAEGLREAHGKGIVHRDIKSANIMVTEKGQVKITDFGLAKLTEGSKVTEDGTTVGTAAYMSPEQARGKKIDRRTDIWSLGVVLYEILSGELPFKGEYNLAIIYSIINDEPKSLAELRTDIPINLEQVLQKALRKEMGERYQKVKELSDDLTSIKEYFDAGNKKQRLPKIKYRRKRQTTVYVSIITLLFALICLGILYKPIMNMISPPRWQNSIAVLPFKNISPNPDQEYLCDGMTEQLISNLSRIQPLKVIARTSVMKFKETEQSIPEIGKELNVASILEGSVQKIGNRLRINAQLIKVKDGFHIWANDYDRELDEIFEIQDDVSNEIASILLKQLSPDDIVKIKTMRPQNMEAYEYYQKGVYHHWKKFFGGAMQGEDFNVSRRMFEKAIEIDSTYALAYAGIADLYLDFGFTGNKTVQEKRAAFEVQKKYAATALKLAPNLSEAHRVYSARYDATGEFEKAFQSLKKALELNPNNAKNNFDLAVFLSKRMLPRQAIEFLNRALELDPLDPLAYGLRGNLYHVIGEYGKAISSNKKALEVDPDCYFVLCDLVEIAISQKKLIEAEKLLVECERVNPTFDYNVVLKSLIQASYGEKENALKSIKSIHTYKGWITVVYAILGMKDETFEHFWGNYFMLQNWGYYDKIRDDPRFEKELVATKKIYEENLKKYGSITNYLH